jgi:hypothetical protein
MRDHSGPSAHQIKATVTQIAADTTSSAFANLLFEHHKVKYCFTLYRVAIADHQVLKSSCSVPGVQLMRCMYAEASALSVSVS